MESRDQKNDLQSDHAARRHGTMLFDVVMDLYDDDNNGPIFESRLK
jgi:hypothetical protein